MKSFQKVDINNKTAVTLAGVHTHTHTIMFTKSSTQIEKAVDYLAWKLTLKNEKKSNKINKKAILKAK